MDSRETWNELHNFQQQQNWVWTIFLDLAKWFVMTSGKAIWSRRNRSTSWSMSFLSIDERMGYYLIKSGKRVIGLHFSIFNKIKNRMVNLADSFFTNRLFMSKLIKWDLYKGGSNTILIVWKVSLVSCYKIHCGAT